MITKTQRVQGFVYEISSEQHTLRTDVPTKLGGSETAMDPHELLESALAGCTAITLQMYAKTKNWPLESVDVRIAITHETAAASTLVRHIKLEGPLSDEQKSRLLEIANKCPIHKLLKSEITIETHAAP